MKHYLLAVALVCFGSSAHAEPYFRWADPAHVYKTAGAYVDPSAPGKSSYGTAVALVTHSPRDGCLLPTVVCEDWSPAMAGLSYNAGRFEFNVGPVANAAPAARAGLLGLVRGVTRDDQLTGLKDVLAGAHDVDGVAIAFGPALNLAPIVRGVILPVTEWAPKFRIFAGAALKF